MQATGGDNDVCGARKRVGAHDARLTVRAAHREHRQRSWARAAGAVNFLALAVTLHRLDPMGHDPRPSAQHLRGTTKPHEEVHGMNVLIGEHPSPLKLPGAALATPVIVGLVTPALTPPDADSVP
jgi:hypothetical protein